MCAASIEFIFPSHHIHSYILHPHLAMGKDHPSPPRHPPPAAATKKSKVTVKDTAVQTDEIWSSLHERRLELLEGGEEQIWEAIGDAHKVLFGEGKKHGHCIKMMAHEQKLINHQQVLLYLLQRADKEDKEKEKQNQAQNMEQPSSSTQTPSSSSQQTTLSRPRLHGEL